MAKKNKTAVATSVPEVASAVKETTETTETTEKIIRVRAVIRSMYAPFSGIMIPDDGPGVFVKRGSWVDVQLKRGLIREC